MKQSSGIGTSSDDDEAWIMEGRIYSPRAAADVAEIAASTLRTWAMAGLIRHAIVCGNYLLHAEDVGLLRQLRQDQGVPTRELRLVLLARAQNAPSRSSTQPAMRNDRAKNLR
jgi:DNA-binding transcriptional MerR regulator